MDIKRVIKAMQKYIVNPDYRFLINADFGKYDDMPDREYLERKFKGYMGKAIDLDNPQTFNEKLQWLKLYDRRPEYTIMVDKYLVREYIKEKLGEEYLIPLIGVWDNPNDIDFKVLPNRFVLKCNHNSGLGMYICKDKSKLTSKDINGIRKNLVRGLAQNYYLTGREWPYKNVPRKIICEKYMEDTTIKYPLESKIIKSGELPPLRDYKIYTFNGKAMLCMINQDRGIHTRADYFDRDYNWLDFTWGYDHADNLPAKPKNYELMYELAEELASGTAELRVDFYEVNGRVYFGELTFFDGSGFDKIEPIEWDYKMGSMIQLPNKEKRTEKINMDIIANIISRGGGY